MKKDIKIFLEKIENNFYQESNVRHYSWEQQLGSEFPRNKNKRRVEEGCVFLDSHEEVYIILKRGPCSPVTNLPSNNGCRKQGLGLGNFCFIITHVCNISELFLESSLDVLKV